MFDDADSCICGSRFRDAKVGKSNEKNLLLSFLYWGVDVAKFTFKTLLIFDFSFNDIEKLK